MVFEDLVSMTAFFDPNVMNMRCARLNNKANSFQWTTEIFRERKKEFMLLLRSFFNLCYNLEKKCALQFIIDFYCMQEAVLCTYPCE